MLRIQRAGYWLALLSILRAPGQTIAPRQFDIVSIHPDRSGDPGYRVRTPPGEKFTATNVTIKTLLLQAFDIKDFQLSGAPGWIDTERYDIAAEFDPSVARIRALSPEELRPLVQSLLLSHFQLKIHRTTKQMPVFSVQAAKGGPKLHRNTGTPGHETDWGSDHINAHDVTVAEFCRVLETQLDRVVVDDTGIAGTFDFKLTWTPEARRLADSAGPSIFTALREQYGLELKSKKGPVEMIIVDRMERPVAN